MFGPGEEPQIVPHPFPASFYTYSHVQKPHGSHWGWEGIINHILFLIMSLVPFIRHRNWTNDNENDSIISGKAKLGSGLIYGQR